MVYLAILLILCGLLILITALSVETGRITSGGNIFTDAGSKTAACNNGSLEPDDVEIIFPGDGIGTLKGVSGEGDVFISFDDEAAEYRIPEQFNQNNKRLDSDSNYGTMHQKETAQQADRRRLDSAGRPEIIERRENNTSSRIDENKAEVSAVMFDDRSNIIDYESGVGAIDSTLSKYKSIKRIGKGIIESDYDGVNFYLDEKLYRFDFHKVYDIWSGSNYIALPLKGNSTVKLFIIENSAGFPGKVEANFKEYEKGL